jgi:hypothetical protein
MLLQFRPEKAGCCRLNRYVIILGQCNTTLCRLLFHAMIGVVSL